MIVDKTHDLLLNATVKKLLKTDSVIAEYFSESELKGEMLKVFPVQLFEDAMNDLGEQVENIKDGRSTVIAISMDVFRRSLLTLAHNLSYSLFESLPRCVGGEVPAEDVRGLPTCVPGDVAYNVIAAPFAKQFESSVYSSIPEVKIDLAQVEAVNGINLALLIQWFVSSKNILYGTLLLILILIAMIVYHPFSSIAQYEGIAFLLSGISGYFFSFGLSFLPAYVLQGRVWGEMETQVMQYVNYLIYCVTAESQKIALIFVAMGMMLIFVRVFVASRYNEKLNE